MLKQPAREKRNFLIKIVFISGIVLTVLGFSISHGWLRHLISALPEFNDLLIGTLIAIVGALMIAVSAKLSVSQQSELLLLPVPKFNLNVKGLTAFAIAIILYFILIFDLYRKKYSHWDILLFFSALLLFGYAVYKIFPSKHSTNKRLFNSTDFLIVVALVSLVIAINLIGLTRWNFAFSGDEAAFYNAGLQVATDHWNWSFFDLTVVYDSHPMMDSVYLGMFMKLFGINITGWRLSLVFMQAASAVLMYLLASVLMGRLSGILAGVVLGSSHYIMSFNRIGYNNTHLLFFSILAVLMLVLAWRTQKSIYVYATGVAMGFCLYTFMAAILIWIIIALVLLMDFCQHRNPKQVYVWVFMIIGFLLVITPALITTSPKEFISTALTQTRAQPVENRWANSELGLENSLLAFWVNDFGHGRFVVGQLTDVITQGLLLIGIAVSIFFFGRIVSRLALLWFALGMAMIAFSNYHSHASITRLLFVLPAVPLLAATAASTFIATFKINFNIHRKVIWAVFLSLLLLIPLLNVYQAQIFSPSLSGFSYFGMALKVLQEYPEKNVTLISREAPSYSDLLVWYPGFSERYNYVNESAAESFILGNLSSLPIFLIYAEEKDIAFNLSEKLPPQYQLILDYDLMDQPRTYLLVPKDAVKKENLTEKILRIFYSFKKYETYIISLGKNHY